jgi:D-proline reductase (dithiol) PrdB
MCIQSGGLIQRAIENAGIPTVGLVNMPDRADRTKYPRAAAVKFPRGATVGRPHDAAMQRRVLLDAFEVLRTADAPGTIVELPLRWSG